jgi:phosphotriesterase-related protein
MSREFKMKGKVQTVLGAIPSEDLGITLPHEHLLCDASVYYHEPDESRYKRLTREPVSIGNRRWLEDCPYTNFDNMRLLDEEAAIEEAMYFKREGGQSIACLSSVGLGRDPLGLASISRATGLNVIMGCGYYISQAQSPDYERKSVEAIAEEMIGDIEVGVGSTGIRAGIIGELGCTYPLKESERNVLLASAIAQKRTGATISIHHVVAHPSEAMELIRVLDGAGADISRVVMGHVDYNITPRDTRLELAKTGCYLEYDGFGNHHFARLGGAAELYGGQVVNCRPCDRERIEQLIELIDAGYSRQILLSQDVCTKIKLVRYGGVGYAHILRTIVPQMLVRGITSELIDTMMVDNPKRALQFV